MFLLIRQLLQKHKNGVCILSDFCYCYRKNTRDLYFFAEEVFSSSKAYWFSPSGDHLLYLTLNDTNVRKSTYFDYGEPGSINDQYPNEVVIRYPKSGTTSPDYKLWHVNLTHGNLETKLFSEAK